MMAVFYFIAHEKGFKFHAQPKTGAYFCLRGWGFNCLLYQLYIYILADHVTRPRQSQITFTIVFTQSSQVLQQPFICDRSFCDVVKPDRVCFAFVAAVL